MTATPNMSPTPHLSIDDDGGLPPEAHQRKARSRQNRTRRRARNQVRKQAAAQQVTEAVERLVENISDSSNSRNELTGLMTQISLESTQSTAICQTTSELFDDAVSKVERMLQETSDSRRKCSMAQLELGKINATINEIVTNVAKASKRQQSALDRMTSLEQLAAKVSHSVGAVIRIADQTNLLALNAAIEAARAGRHGKGFAVVAEHVRNLAETAEKNAANIEELIQQIRGVVTRISSGVSASTMAAQEEVERGTNVQERLSLVNENMHALLQGTTHLNEQATTINLAIQEARRGAQAIAMASEKQSASCESALRTLHAQNESVNQYDKAVEDLVGLIEELSGSDSDDLLSSAEEVEIASDGLSANLTRYNLNASRLLEAIRDISRGAGQQDRTVNQILGSVDQIDGSVQQCTDLAVSASERVGDMVEHINNNRESLREMVEGIHRSLNQGQATQDAIQDLEKISKHIDKIVYAIANVAIQTSMLAVNGAVESARAGDYGKGFAVVSSDIQNLASDAADNAEEIKELVKAIQELIIVVRLEVSSVADKAAHEAMRGDRIVEALATLEERFSEQVESKHQIQTIINELSGVVSRANRNMGHIATSTGDINMASSSAFKVSCLQTDSANAMASIIEDIATTAKELQVDEDSASQR